MKIILTSTGTQGDIEPFLAIGKFLKEKGHQVICAFPEQFRELTESCGMEFASLGSKNDDLLASDIGKTALGGSGFKKIFAFLKLMKLAQDQEAPQKKKLNYTKLLNKKTQIE